MSPATSSKPTDAGRARLDELVEVLTAAGVAFERGQMFGCPGVRHVGKGKFFVTLWADDLVFKLDDEAYATALALDGAHVLEPMPGRPMRRWVMVPAAHAVRDAEFGEAASRTAG